MSHMFDARREHARLAHEGSLTMQAVTHPLECVGGAAMRTAHETEHRPTVEGTDRLRPARLFSGATAAERSTRVLSRREAEHRDFCQAKAMLAAHVRLSSAQPSSAHTIVAEPPVVRSQRAAVGHRTRIALDRWQPVDSLGPELKGLFRSEGIQLNRLWAYSTHASHAL